MLAAGGAAAVQGQRVAAAHGERPAARSQDAPARANPCHGAANRRSRLCPDLVMKPPAHVRIDRHGGRRLLRSESSIDNVGHGPASLRGRRDGRLTMRAYQVIHRRAGPPMLVRTGARLYFQPIPGQERYWKFADAARFELWSLDSELRRVALVRAGPKQNYCLRDLERTRRLRRSPRRRAFPGCSQDPRQRRATLGTSVGWSDVYPAGYHQNWIDVTGLPPGRYAYVHIADPGNGIWERREGNNEAEVIVSLPSGRVLR